MSRSAIPETTHRIKAISAGYELPIVVFGHAGDGSLHPNILFDRRDAEQWAKVERIVDEILGVALGSVPIDVQRRIKQVLDPLNIMNPGRVLL